MNTRSKRARFPERKAKRRAEAIARQAKYDAAHPSPPPASGSTNPK